MSGEPEAEDTSTAPPSASVADDETSAVERDTEAETMASPVETQTTSIIPDIPVSSEPLASETTQPLESVESPKHDHDRPEPSHAQTIDEAIAEFESAVKKTPEPESLTANEALSAVERDNTADNVDQPSPAETVKTDADESAATPKENGSTSELQSSEAPAVERPAALRHSSDNISATAPRVIAKTPPPPPKEPAATHDEENGEDTTMEDVDIN